MNNNLATIQKVRNVRKHSNADKLSVCNILGWQVVFNHEMNSYKDDDLVVYITIDTILPEKPEFEFLRNRHFRVRPMRLRGVESAGICFPVSILPFKENDIIVPSLDGKEYIIGSNYKEGDDVTELLGILHYKFLLL